jgi:hypothetical protein
MAVTQSMFVQKLPGFDLGLRMECIDSRFRQIEKSLEEYELTT